MDIPCNFERIDGGWKCRECGHVHSRPIRRPPVRLCGSPKPQSAIRPKRPRPKIERKARSVTRVNSPTIAKPEILLGDHVKNALEKVGISEEKVTKWLGRPCGCAKRRQKLNNLHLWIRQILGNEREQGEKQLNEALDD